MASNSAPPSLQRTNSNGHLNVYLLIKNKINDDLLIISQDSLPPTLRTGKLILNQKVTIRDDQRRNIDAVIIYMHHDRENCVVKKNELLRKTKNGDKSLDISNGDGLCASKIIVGNKNSSKTVKKSSHLKEKNKINESEKNSTLASITSLSHDLSNNKGDDDDNGSDVTCASQTIVGNKNSNKTVKKSSHLKEKNKITESEKNSTLASSPSSSHRLFIDEDFEEDDNDVTCASMEYSLSLTGKTNQHDETNTNFDDTVQSSLLMEENDDSSDYLEQIKDLTNKVQQQAQIIKNKNAQIQRLLLTTIEIPTDLGAQNYILYAGDKIRQQTTKYKYQGNLVDDALKLGLSRSELNEILSSKSGITSIARILFQKIVPKNLLQVQHWKDLDPYVLHKENKLIKFMERFYGPLQVDKIKIHRSLVNCLRNKRNIRKKIDQNTCTENNGEEINNNENIGQMSDRDAFNTN